jgi:hypothetical protein
MEGFIPSLLGEWMGVEQKSVYTSSGDGGCYAVTRKFTFRVEFLADHTLRGMLKHDDIEDDCGSSQSITGSWRVTDVGDVVTIVNQTCYVDDGDDDIGEKQPVAEIRVIKEGNFAKCVIVDDSNSRINHESHCEDIHVIKCSRIM